MEITEDDAKLIVRALMHVNQHYAGELDRIMVSDESVYLKEAAVKQYNSDSEAFTKLHLRLAEVFPSLTQRS